MQSLFATIISFKKSTLSADVEVLPVIVRHSMVCDTTVLNYMHYLGSLTSEIERVKLHVGSKHVFILN